MSPSAAALWAGIDLGGTGTRVALVTSVGEAVAGVTVPTRSFDDGAVERVAVLIRELIPPGVELSGIGIGASGPVDLTSGQIRNPHTLPQFTGLDLASDLQQLLSTPTWIDNDAVVAGLAESTWGAGSGASSVLSVTLGTGIGAVLIQDERPIRAADGQHPEGGHIAVAGAGNPCYCGLPQCWEQVASRTALNRLRETNKYPESQLWLEYANQLASGLVSLLTLYHPASVVIGGSVAQHWQQLKDPLRQALTPYREFDPSVRLDASPLGEQAGALGATLLPQRRIGWHPGSGNKGAR